MRDQTGLNGTKNGGGWEQCSHPITNDEVWGEEEITDELIQDVLGGVSGEMSNCPACHGNQKMFLGTLGKSAYARCRDCGTIFEAPYLLGVVRIKEERILEDK